MFKGKFPVVYFKRLLLFNALYEQLCFMQPFLNSKCDIHVQYKNRQNDILKLQYQWHDVSKNTIVLWLEHNVWKVKGTQTCVQKSSHRLKGK